jgi:hypothetical protein
MLCRHCADILLCPVVSFLEDEYHNLEIQGLGSERCTRASGWRGRVEKTASSTTLFFSTRGLTNEYAGDRHAGGISMVCASHVPAMGILLDGIRPACVRLTIPTTINLHGITSNIRRSIRQQEFDKWRYLFLVCNPSKRKETIICSHALNLCRISQHWSINGSPV